MLELDFDLQVFERAARDLNGARDQVPFALSQAMNDAAFATRKHLVEVTWPRSVTVRNPRFIAAALRVDTATKTNLVAGIRDQLGRANLRGHAEGGVKKALSGRLAIPSSRVTRTSRGVPKSQRPGNLKRKVVKGGLIFQATGGAKNSKLRLMYKLQATARQPKDVPFYEDFRRVFIREMSNAFPKRLQAAMRTRRR